MLEVFEDMRSSHYIRNMVVTESSKHHHAKLEGSLDMRGRCVGKKCPIDTVSKLSHPKIENMLHKYVIFHEKCWDWNAYLGLHLRILVLQSTIRSLQQKLQGHILTHWGLVMPFEIRVNIGLGNGLLPDGTKPLPEPMLTDHQRSPVTFILGQFQKRCLNHQSLESFWKLHV